MAGLVVFTLIVAALDVAFFLYTVFANHITWFSAEFDYMLASLIASIIVLIIYAAISEIPIFGPLIVGFLTLIDTILSLFAGFSISGWLAKIITKMIYGYDSMVDLGATAGDMSLTQATASLGFSVGNSLVWSFPMTSTAKHKDPSAWQAQGYGELYTQDALKSTSLHYTLGPTKADVAAKRGDMSSRWATLQYDHTHWGWKMYRTSVVDKITSSSIPLNQAGVNQKYTLWLNLGYSIPAVECWTIWVWAIFVPVPIPVCYRRTADGQSPQSLPAMVLDIFPKSLDDFAAWNWGNNSSLPLPAPKDRDGDGLGR